VTWEIPIPFRDRFDPLHLVEIHDLVHEAISEPTKQRVTRELMFDLATTPGVETYADVLIDSRRPGRTVAAG
jgi:hypothetical protein